MEGGDTNPYQLEGLGPDATDKANKFLHSLSSWSSAAVCISIVYLIFSVMVVNDLEKLTHKWNNLPAAYKSTGHQMADQVGVMGGGWGSGIGGVVITCCFGGCVVACARKMVQDRCLKVCCCVGYSFSCLYCLNGTGLCFAFGSFLAIYNALGDPAQLCRVAAGSVGGLGTTTVAPSFLVAPVPVTTVGPAGSNVFAKEPQLPACSGAIEVFKGIVFLMSIFFLILGCCMCGQSSTCAAAGNFANETQDAMDAEGGGGYEAGYGQPGSSAFMS